MQRIVCLWVEPAKKTQLLALAEECLRWSPQLAIRESGAVFIEVGKCQALYSENKFLNHMKSFVEGLNLKFQAAVASDLPSALALAQYAPGFGTRHTDLSEVQAIARLPIEALLSFSDPLGLDPDGQKSLLKMTETLKRLGVRQVGKFQELPSAQLPSRFGALALYCKQRLEKTREFPWRYWIPPLRFFRRMDFLPSEFCSEIEPLLFRAKEVLDQIFGALSERGLGAERITFSIELEKNSLVQVPVRTWSFELLVAQGATSGFLPILRERLSRDLERSPLPTLAIAMSCEAFSVVHARGAQKSLGAAMTAFGSAFGGALSPEQEESLGTLVGELEELLGDRQVFWAKTTENRFPEKSWEKLRQRPAATEPPEGRASRDLTDQIPLRPTRIFKNPIPVTLLQDRVVLRGRVFRILRSSLCERISGDWLDEVPARNYYQVDIEGGKRFFIFSDPGHHFFIHGYFE